MLFNPKSGSRQLLKQKSFSVPFMLAFAAIFGFIGFHYLFNSKAVVPSTPTVMVCGERQASDVEQYTGPALGSSPISSEAAINFTANNTSVSDFQFLPGSPNKMYIKSGTGFYIYNADTGSLISTFSIAGVAVDGGSKSNFALDPAGNVYVTGTFGLYKINTSGSLVWSKTAAAPLDHGAYGYGSGVNFRVAAVGRNLNGSYTWDTSGNPQNTNIVIGNVFHMNLRTGDITSGDGGYIRIYSPDGLTQKFYMGTNLPPGGAGPFHFYSGGGADELPDGRIVVMDGRGLYFFDSGGTYLGAISNDPGATTTGATATTQYGSDVLYFNGSLYFISGKNFGVPQTVSKLAQTTADTALNAPQGAPFHLGIGAGPFTNAPANYFPSGTAPQVFMQFYPWWAAHAGSYSGQYTIRTIQQVLANQTVTPTSFNLSGLSSSAITNIPVTLPTIKPGFYEMDVQLKNNSGIVIGADCLQYSVGAPGDSLDFSALPAGGDAYDIALAHQFGARMIRGSAVKLSNLLPAPDPCVGAINFPSSLDSAVQAAAAEASADGVIYEIQLADGAAAEKAAVSGGCWPSRVQEVVSHFKPYIHAWEAWNEGNNTYSGNGTTFANDILTPFANAVKTADPGATVVAGSVLNISTGFWQAVCAAGGLNQADAIGDHPYTGHNRSFEEQGQIAQLQSIQNVLSACGHANLPIWNTEGGFWSNGTMSEYTQGEKVVRRTILQDSIGIHNTVNFTNYGSFGGWSLLNTYLKEGGLASVTMKHKLGGRNFVKWIPTGIPHTYAADYGPAGADSSHVAAVWSDDYSVNAIPLLDNAADMTITDEWGGTSSLAAHSALTLTGQVQYIDVPAGRVLNITPAESYGPDLALASAGSTASATSSTAANPAALAIDGITDTQGKGNNSEGISAWIQHYTDTNPELTVTLPQPATLDRIYVSSQGISSVQTGLRSFDVQVDNGSGSFTTVAQVKDQFFARNHLVSFAAQTVKRIKLTNLTVNYSGYGDGLPPDFWPSDAASLDKDDVWAGQDTVYEVEAYAAGQQSAPPPGKVGDLNADGAVNILDLSILLSNYNMNGTVADLNKDGTVNIFDLSILLSGYGS